MPQVKVLHAAMMIPCVATKTWPSQINLGTLFPKMHAKLWARGSGPRVPESHKAPQGLAPQDPPRKRDQSWLAGRRGWMHLLRSWQKRGRRKGGTLRRIVPIWAKGPCGTQKGAPFSGESLPYLTELLGGWGLVGNNDSSDYNLKFHLIFLPRSGYLWERGLYIYP